MLSRGREKRKVEVLEVGLDLILQRHAQRRGITERPRIARPSSSPEYVSAHVKAAVTKRDNGECQFPLDGGGICGSKRDLQFDHIRPRAMGGPGTVENVRLLCAYHNAVAARATLGNEVMDAYTQRGRATGGA